MRVLLTTESFLPYQSGVTVSVDALARGLGARGHEIMVLAPRPAAGERPEPVGSPGPEPRYGWLPSYQLPALAPPRYRMPWPIARSGALDEARAFRPDVVHANSPFVSGLLARALAHRLDVPLVFTHHTRFGDYGHYLGPLAGPGARVTRGYLRRFWLACAAIVAPSEDLAREIRGSLPASRADRVLAIPTGIDVQGIRAIEPIDPRPAAGWPAEAIVVASLGRLAPEKSPEVITEAVAAAGKREPALRLLMIGGGPCEDRLRERASAPDLAGRAELIGALPRPEALARLAGADLFVFASRTETQGLVLAEALAAGLPAVALDGPGVADSVRDGIDGVIVPTEPAATLIARLGNELAALAAGERRASMAERARADADRFDIRARVTEMETLYESLTRP